VREPELTHVRALTFDVFGTTVDWLAGVAAEARRLGALSGVAADWEQLALAWRALYVPSMDRVRRGELPWTNFDRLHRISLDQVLREVGAEGFDPAARAQLTRGWERLPAWPDSAPGLKRLARRFTVTTLSNGNRSQQTALIRFAGLPFPRILSAETSTTTSPIPRSIWARRPPSTWRRAR
jgi:2-haloacid dehalogenase